MMKDGLLFRFHINVEIGVHPAKISYHNHPAFFNSGCAKITATVMGAAQCEGLA
jgi:hypothetical protein